MNTRDLLLPVLLLGLAACSPPPDLTPLDADGGAIVAQKVSGDLPLDPGHERWGAAAEVEVRLYPQQSVAPGSRETKGLNARVRALHNGKALALRLEWDAAAAAEERGVGRFADAVSVQWPLRYGPGVELPYLGMGHAGHPAALWFWRAGDGAQSLAAEGFGSLTVQDDDGLEAQGSWHGGTWRVVFRRGLAAAGEHSVTLPSRKTGLIPLALAVWNGTEDQRNGDKRLSAWRALYLEGSRADEAYIRQLVDASTATADAQRGRDLMTQHGCSACHAFPDNPAQPAIGPGLYQAGGIFHREYLVESITEPSKVIVSGKGFFTVQDGQRHSLMPPFQGPEQDLEDLVAYLKTLR